MLSFFSKLLTVRPGVPAGPGAPASPLTPC